MGDVKPLVAVIRRGITADLPIIAGQRIGRIGAAVDRINVVFALDRLKGIEAVNRFQIGMTAERT